MHYVVLAKDLESLSDLPEVTQGLRLFEARFFLEELLEGASVAELIDEVEIVDGLEHVIIFDDMLTRFKVAEDVDFVNGALLELGKFPKLIGFDHLDGDHLFGLHVHGFIHGGVDSAAQLAL